MLSAYSLNFDFDLSLFVGSVKIMEILEASENFDFRPLFSSHFDGSYKLPNGKVIKAFTRSAKGDSDKEGCPMLFLDNIWPSAYCLSDYLVKNPSLCNNKYVLELGAAAAIPSCVSDALNAKRVVITDYPASNVIETIQLVIETNKLNSSVAIPHIWGENIELLNSYGYNNQGYHLILLADLLWKDTYLQHSNLLQTISSCLLNSEIDDSIALVAFAHRPTATHTRENDMEFFSLAELKYSMICEHLLTSSDYGCDIDSVETIEIHLYSMKSKR